MSKNRDEQKKRQRENRRLKRVSRAKERQLDKKNAFGIVDETPYQAVNNIINSKTKEG